MKNKRRKNKKDGKKTNKKQMASSSKIDAQEKIQHQETSKKKRKNKFKVTKITTKQHVWIKLIYNSQLIGK